MIRGPFRFRFVAVTLCALLAFGSVQVVAQEVTLFDQLAFDIAGGIRALTPTTQRDASSVCELADG